MLIEANSLAWLGWHVARVQDAQVAEALGGPAVYVRGMVERAG